MWLQFHHSIQRVVKILHRLSVVLYSVSCLVLYNLNQIDIHLQSTCEIKRINDCLELL